MTEQQLREKLQFAYGTMPDATRAAFEHSLTHHRAPETHRSIGLSRMMRIVPRRVRGAALRSAGGNGTAEWDGTAGRVANLPQRRAESGG